MKKNFVNGHKNGYLDPDQDPAGSIIIWPAESGSISIIQDYGSKDSGGVGIRENYLRIHNTDSYEFFFQPNNLLELRRPAPLSTWAVATHPFITQQLVPLASLVTRSLYQLSPPCFYQLSCQYVITNPSLYLCTINHPYASIDNPFFGNRPSILCSARACAFSQHPRASIPVMDGIFKQSMGARNRVGKGLSYRPARGGIFKLLRSPGIDFVSHVSWLAGTKTLFLLLLSPHRLLKFQHRLHSLAELVLWNRFLVSLKV
jgi:hypothetical protein